MHSPGPPLVQPNHRARSIQLRPVQRHQDSTKGERTLGLSLRPIRGPPAGEAPPLGAARQRRALVYLAHCDPVLTERLLAANWSPSGLTSLAFLGVPPPLSRSPQPARLPQPRPIPEHQGAGAAAALLTKGT